MLKLVQLSNLSKVKLVKQAGSKNLMSSELILEDVVKKDNLASDGTIKTIHSGLNCVWDNEMPIIPKKTFFKMLNSAVKRMIDIVVAGLSLLILSPFLLFISLLIKLYSPGPIFFRQERVGYKNQPFKIFKFRTMYHHKADISGVEQTKKDDCRITKIGRVLRKTSIDELPQLINILRGEMSFVGPRPFVKGQLADGKPYKEVVAYYDLRYEVVPGLTGWAQANGYRGLTEDRSLAIKRIEHDMAYIQNASIVLDIKIIFLTIKNEFFSGSGH